MTESEVSVERYSRQMLFPGIGRDGQIALSKALVVVVGCGALGSVQTEMLARAGVGRIRIVDRDTVETSNLHRQVMFDEKDAAEGIPKAIAAAQRLSQINSEVQVEPVVADVNFSNVEKLVADADVVLDATDNFETRYLLNDAAVELGRPWIYGAAVGGHGAQMTIIPGETPCLRCVFPDAPVPGTTPTCDTAGVILPIISVVASFQVTEAFKLLTGRREGLHHKLLQWDIWEGKTAQIRLAGRDAECIACGQRRFEYLDGQNRQLVTSLCGRNSVQITPAFSQAVNFDVLAERLRKSQEIRYNRYLIKFAADQCEITVFPDARAIIKGTSDLAVARSLYAKYVGA